MRSRLLTGALAIAITFVLPILATGAAPAGATTPTQAKYIKNVRFLDPAAKNDSNKTILKAGTVTCTDLKSGTSIKSLAKIWNGPNKAVLVEAAAILCPKYNVKVTTYYASTTTTVPVPQLTQQQRSAVAEAKQYLQTSAFSQQGLIDQLDSSAGSGYSVADATVAVDSLTVNWNAEAEQAAKAYLSTQPFSCQDLIDQLDSQAGDQYTVAQATYGAQQAGDCG